MIFSVYSYYIDPQEAVSSSGGLTFVTAAEAYWRRFSSIVLLTMDITAI